MKFYLISYATGKYKEFQTELHDSIHVSEFIHKKYGFEDIDKNFYQKNKNILDRERGAGYWLWKPYFILKTLNEVDDGDVVVYIDCGDRLHENPIPYLTEKLKEINSVILMGYHSHENWCKRVCFEKMGCNSEMYIKSRQLEAGFCAFKKCSESIDLVSEWLKFCENSDILTDDLVSNEKLYFRDHRHDQAILTNLVIKNNITTVNIGDIYKYVNFNEKS